MWHIIADDPFSLFFCRCAYKTILERVWSFMMEGKIQPRQRRDWIELEFSSGGEKLPYERWRSAQKEKIYQINNIRNVDLTITIDIAN
jgi:hypothetical protein